MKSKAKAPHPAPLSLAQKLAQAQSDQQKWLAVAGSPELAPQDAQAALEAARSSQAAARLYQKALTYQAPQTPDAALVQTLGLDNSPQGQPSALGMQSQS